MFRALGVCGMEWGMIAMKRKYAENGRDMHGREWDFVMVCCVIVLW